MSLSLNQTVPPVTTLVSLADAKLHCGVGELDDDRLTTIIEDATYQVERDSNLCILSQTWQAKMSFFPLFLYSPVTPVSALTVSYLDPSGDSQSFTDFSFVSSNYRCSIQFNSQPDVIQDRLDAVTITFTCGMSAVPPAARRACLLLIGAWNENREAEIVGTISKKIELGYERCIGILRRGHI